MKVPFLDYRGVNEPHFSAYQDAIRRVLESGWYILGKEVEAFEAEYAAYVGTPYCVGVANGLDDLILILEGYKAMGLMRNGENRCDVSIRRNDHLIAVAHEPHCLVAFQN